MRLRAESKERLTLFFYIAKTAAAASTELNAVMQKCPSEKRCELSGKIMSLYLKRHRKNTLAFSAHNVILLQSAGNDKHVVFK